MIRRGGIFRWQPILSEGTTISKAIQNRDEPSKVAEEGRATYPKRKRRRGRGGGKRNRWEGSGDTVKRNKRRCSAPLYSVAGPSLSLSLKLSMIVLKGEGVESSESRERTTREEGREQVHRKPV